MWVQSIFIFQYILLLMVLQKMEILPVNDLDIALHNFVNKDDKMAFYSCVQYNINETRVSILYCFCLPYAFVYDIAMLEHLVHIVVHLVSSSYYFMCSCYCHIPFSSHWWLIFVLLQNKIAKDSDTLKFEEEALIVKVGECLEVRSFVII